jgi:hypothetical protein
VVQLDFRRPFADVEAGDRNDTQAKHRSFGARIWNSGQTRQNTDVIDVEMGGTGNSRKPNRLSLSIVSVSLDESSPAETHLAAHYVEDENSDAIVAIKDTAGSFHNLSIARLPHLGQPRATLRLLHKLLDV